MSIHQRKTKSGVRWDVRLRDPAGRVYTRSFRTRREAKNFEAQERADRSRAAWLDPRRSEIDVKTWAREWLVSDPGKRSSSLARDESIIRKHIVPVLGSRTLVSLTPRDVQALVNRWSVELAPRTVRRQYDVLRALLNAAVTGDRLLRSPCRGIKLPTFTVTDRRLLTAEELVTLADAVGPESGAIVFLGAVLGLRWGECAGLRVGRIDFLGGTLSVLEQRTRGMGGAMVSGLPKSDAGRRKMSVPQPLLRLLADHLVRRGLNGADPDAWVFVGRDGKPLDYSNWRHRAWLPALRNLGLEGLKFHDLRHLAATTLVESGVDVKTTQARLGHSDPRLTLSIYAQMTTEADRAAAELLAVRLMRPAPAPRDGRAMGVDGGASETGGAAS